MTFKKIAVTLGISAALGLGAAGQASATAVANAMIDVSHFVITNGSGTPLDLSDFRFSTTLCGGRCLSFTDTLTNAANLNGSPVNVGPVSTNSFGGLDLAMACIGAGCAGIPQNFFAPSAAPPLVPTFARGDSLLSGAPISGTPFATGARAATIAETSINHENGTGGSNSDIVLTSSLQFMLDHPASSVGVSFDAATFLRAWTASGSLFGTEAGANMSWELKLVDGVTHATLVDWKPGAGTATGLDVTSEPCTLNDVASATFDQPSAPTDACSGTFTAFTTFALLANHPYSFTIGQHVITQATEVERTVAEPGALALFGIALAGLGFVRRRRS